MIRHVAEAADRNRLLPKAPMRGVRCQHPTCTSKASKQPVAASTTAWTGKERRSSCSCCCCSCLQVCIQPTCVNDIPATVDCIQECCEHLLVRHVISIAQIRAGTQTAEVQVRHCRSAQHGTAQHMNRGIVSGVVPPHDCTRATSMLRLVTAATGLDRQPLLLTGLSLHGAPSWPLLHSAALLPCAHCTVSLLTFLWCLWVLRHPCHPVEVIGANCCCQRLCIQPCA